MAEQRIVILIDENGKIEASTQGLAGEMCLDELQELLDDLEQLDSIKKTEDFYKKPKVIQSKNIINRQ